MWEFIAEGIQVGIPVVQVLMKDLRAKHAGFIAERFLFDGGFKV